MKTVLIISYSYPPMKNVGAIRIQGLANYLKKIDGYKVIILTAPCNRERAELDKEEGIILYETENNIPNQTQTNNTTRIIKFTNNIKETMYKNKLLYQAVSALVENIYFPDKMTDWYDSALQETENIIKHHKIDAIITSSTPFTCHLIGKYIKMRYNIPWIADLRDLWSQNHYIVTEICRKRHQQLEKNTLEYADAITTVSEPLKRRLADIYTEKKIFSIPNGFEDEILNINLNKKINLDKKFTITYTGTLYGHKRNPYPLLSSIKKLIDEGSIEKSDVKINFLGDTPHGYLKWLKN